MENIIMGIISEITGLEIDEINVEDEFENDLSMDEEEIFDLFDTLESHTGITLLGKRRKLKTIDSLANYINKFQ